MNKVWIVVKADFEFFYFYSYFVTIFERGRQLERVVLSSCNQIMLDCLIADGQSTRDFAGKHVNFTVQRKLHKKLLNTYSYNSYLLYLYITLWVSQCFNKAQEGKGNT